MGAFTSVSSGRLSIVSVGTSSSQVFVEPPFPGCADSEPLSTRTVFSVSTTFPVSEETAFSESPPISGNIFSEDCSVSTEEPNEQAVTPIRKKAKRIYFIKRMSEIYIFK